MGSCNNPMGSCNNPMTDPCDERYMYLHESLIFTVNVGKYTVRPMNPMEWLVFEQAYFYHSINYWFQLFFSNYLGDLRSFGEGFYHLDADKDI